MVLANSFPWPSLESTSVQTHLLSRSQSPLPFFSLQIMLSRFGEESGGTGGWGQCLAVSFLPLVTSFSFLPLFLPFCFICAGVGFSVGLISLGEAMGVPVSTRVSPALCTIIFTSRCFLSCLLGCIPPHPPVSSALSSSCPFLTRLERLQCWCMVAWLNPLPN